MVHRDDKPAAPLPLEDADLARVTGGTTPPSFGQGSPSLEEMLAAMQQQRSDVLDTQIQAQMVAVQDGNDWLHDANTVLRELLHDRPTDAQGESAYGTFVDHAGVTQDVKSWLEASGIGVPDAGNDGTGTRNEFEATISNLKNGMDAATAACQADMQRLQALLNQRNTAAPIIGGG